MYDEAAEKLAYDINVEIILHGLRQGLSDILSDDPAVRQAGIDMIKYAAFFTAEIVKTLE